MDKLRLSVYWENGTDKEGNELIYVLRDDLVDVKEGLIDEVGGIHEALKKLNALMDERASQ